MRIRWFLSFIVVCVGSCAGPTPHEQRFTGVLDGFGATAATLTRMGGSITFTPNDGVLVLPGTVAGDGALAAELNTQPQGKPPFVLTLRGRMDAERAELTYATPRCTARGVLTRAHLPVF